MGIRPDAGHHALFPSMEHEAMRNGLITSQTFSNLLNILLLSTFGK